MARNCAVVKNTSTVASLKEDEIELELGLSIGGGYQRPEKLKPIKEGQVQVQQTSNSNSDGSEADPCEENRRHLNNNLESCTRSSVSSSLIGDAEQDIDPQVKREIQAARRQEAKKKIEKKQQRKRMREGQNGENANEYDITERQSKRSKIGDDVAGSGSNEDEIKNMNGKLTGEENRDYNAFSNPIAYIASPMCAAIPVQNQLPPLQCVPVINGFAYPYTMPCWAQTGAGVGRERKVIRAVANRSAGPVQAMSESNLSLSMRSSSTVSENLSSSPQGGGSSSSSDMRRHLNVSLREQNQKNDTKERPEGGVSAHLLESAESINKSTNHIDQPALNAIESSPTKPKEEPISVTKPHHPSGKLISTPETTPAPNTFRETKGKIGKPPKPVNSNLKATITTRPNMPCVSTTGNGPNGKTVNGFLYRYTKTEVSIVCVCHGATFSPVEFVEHAGGTDLSQPLRHITVIPSAF